MANKSRNTIKLSDVFSFDTPWNAKISDYADQTVDVLGIEEFEGGFGPAFLVSFLPIPTPDDVTEPLIAQVNHTVLYKQMTALAQAEREGLTPFPIQLVLKRQGSGTSRYLMFFDPGEVP